MINKALEGVNVLTFELAQAGPMTSGILANFGATVIRVESQTRLDWHRMVGPFIGDQSSPDRSACFYHVNGGKMGTTINLKNPAARPVLERLIKWADVVNENFAGGVMARLGLGYADLKKIRPDIIMLSSDTYGQTGPFAGTPLYGLPLTALTGLPHLTGAPEQLPQFPGFAITDFIAPRANVMGIISALDYRRRTGQGQYIDAAQFESTIPMMSPVVLQYAAEDILAGRIGNRSTYAAPHGVYPCTGDDNWVAISVMTDEMWPRFCAAAGHPEWADDARFATLADRLENQDALDAAVDAWTQTLAASQVQALLQAADVAAGVVQGGRGLTDDPQLEHLGFYTTLEYPEIGEFSHSGWPVTMSRTPYEVKRAPMLGEHNETVLADILGFSEEEIADLLAEGAVE